MDTGRESFVYSYSKIKAFETCPLKFRYRYLERVATSVESIEAFAGRRVHEVLEALYGSLAADPRPPALGEVLALYDQAWQRAWHGGVEVVKEAYSASDYRRLGGRCLITFYRGNWPFTADRTLGLETGVAFDLAGPGSPRLAGVVDRIAVRAGGDLLIHDYKTSTYLPGRKEILNDLQLAIYQLGASDRWPGREVGLIWHFLAFGRRVTVRLCRSGLEEKRAHLGRRIAAIERAIAQKEFPPRVSRLCGWCSFRSLCPAYGESQPAGYPSPRSPRAAWTAVDRRSWGQDDEARLPPRQTLRLRLDRLHPRRRPRRSRAVENLAQLRFL